MDFIILDELRQLIPPLSVDEFEQLEANCLNDGIRDKFIIGEFPCENTGELINVLIDGHNRYQISEKHGLVYGTTTIQFSSINAVKIWMIDNQKGRRNLTDGWKWELAQTRLKLLRRKGRENMSKAGSEGGRGNTKGLSLNDKSFNTHNTREEIAKDLGWSTGKVAQAQVLWGCDNKELKEKVKSGTLSIGGAYSLHKNNGAHVSNNSGECEWYTPLEIIELARDAMGSIDTDPASSETANDIVRASTFYTKEQDGLKFEWHGNVWLNPPYRQPTIGQFLEKAKSEYESGNSTQLVILTNNATETKAGQSILRYSSAVCFPLGRVKFWSKDKYSKTPLQGQMIIYVGPNIENFIKNFESIGVCLKRV